MTAALMAEKKLYKFKKNKMVRKGNLGIERGQSLYLL